LFKSVAGLVVPIPTRPDESILIASAPPSAKAIVSAAGKKIPVLASVPRIAGVEAEPSMSDTPSDPLKIKLIPYSL
jgi:hypothetical protein